MNGLALQYGPRSSHCRKRTLNTALLEEGASRKSLTLRCSTSLVLITFVFSLDHQQQLKKSKLYCLVSKGAHQAGQVGLQAGPAHQAWSGGDLGKWQGDIDFCLCLCLCLCLRLRLRLRLRLPLPLRLKKYNRNYKNMEHTTNNKKTKNIKKRKKRNN